MGNVPLLPGGRPMALEEPTAPEDEPASSAASAARREAEAEKQPLMAPAGTIAEDGAVPSCCGRGWPALWAVVLLDTLAGILTLLIVPDLGAAYFGGGRDPCLGEGKGTPACAAAISRFSSVSAAFGFASAALSFVCGPLAGVAADEVGTKPILVLSIFVKLGIALALIGVSWAGLSVYYLFGSSELAALVPTRLTFGLWVMQKTPPQARSQVYARLTAVLTLEGIIAPLATMFLNRRNTPALVMALSLAALGSSMCCLEPDRPGKAERESLPGAGQSIVARFQIRGVLKLFSDPSYSSIMLLVLIGGTSAEGVRSIWFFFLKERFGMDMASLGPVIVVITLSKVVCQVWLVGPLEKSLGLRGVILFSFVAGLCSCIGYLLAPSVHWLYFVAALSGLGSIAAPIVAAVLTNVASPDGRAGNVGVTLGMVQSVTSITSIIGPLIFKLVFSFSLQPGHMFAGAVWVLASLLDITGIALAARLPKMALVPGRYE